MKGYSEERAKAFRANLRHLLAQQKANKLLDELGIRSLIDLAQTVNIYLPSVEREGATVPNLRCGVQVTLAFREQDKPVVRKLFSQSSIDRMEKHQGFSANWWERRNKDKYQKVSGPYLYEDWLWHKDDDRYWAERVTLRFYQRVEEGHQVSDDCFVTKRTKTFQPREEFVLACEKRA